jgi:hypothetical protein
VGRAHPLAALLLLLLAACGPSAVARPTTPPSARATPLRGIGGTVRYEARSVTARGLSQELDVRPARYVEVLTRAADGRDLDRALTDAEGRFSLPTRAEAAALVVRARSQSDGRDLAVAADPFGRQVYERVVPLAGTATDALDVRAQDDDARGTGGAFHILDTLVRGVDAVTRWTGRSLPPLFVYWARGGTSEWSFYRGERPQGSGRFALELMGGNAGHHRESDTDEHDEAIILHELGHFVFDRLTTDSSIGGLHPDGTLVDPGVAWEEGRASWFATSVLGAPFYRDTIGHAPGGSLRVDQDFEHVPAGPSGAGSERAVAGVLWDLADGVDGIPDTDADGVALGPEALMRAMIALTAEPGAMPELSGFLRFLVRTSAVTPTALEAVLSRAQQPRALLPADDVPRWPRSLALPGQVAGKIDGVTNPAPSGGPPRPENGIDAVHAYRVELPRAGFFTAALDVRGESPGGRDRLSLELRSLRGVLLTASREGGPRERLGRVLEAGWYTVYVRDRGDGNRASYTLRVALE